MWLAVLWAIELLMEFGVVEAEFGLLIVDLGVLETGVHHVEDALHDLRSGSFDDLEDLLVPQEI